MSDPRTSGDWQPASKCTSDLFLYAQLAQCSSLEQCIAAGADVNFVDRFGDTPLLVASAVESGSNSKSAVATVAALLDAGAHIYDRNESGKWAGCIAQSDLSVRNILVSRLKISLLQCARGKDAPSKAHDTRSKLKTPSKRKGAMQLNRQECVPRMKSLLDIFREDLTLPRIPRAFAVKMVHAAAAWETHAPRAFCGTGVGVAEEEGAGREGMAAAAVAAADANANVLMLRLLVKELPSLLAPGKKTSDDDAALDIGTASDICDDAAFDLLRARDAKGRTALHHAAAAGNIVSVRELLCMGADPTLRSSGSGATDAAGVAASRDVLAVLCDPGEVPECRQMPNRLFDYFAVISCEFGNEDERDSGDEGEDIGACDGSGAAPAPPSKTKAKSSTVEWRFPATDHHDFAFPEPTAVAYFTCLPPHAVPEYGSAQCRTAPTVFSSVLYRTAELPSIYITTLCFQCGPSLTKSLCLFSHWPFLDVQDKLVRAVYATAETTAASTGGRDLSSSSSSLSVTSEHAPRTAELIVQLLTQVPLPVPGGAAVCIDFSGHFARCRRPVARSLPPMADCAFEWLFSCLDVDVVLSLLGYLLVGRSVLLITKTTALLTPIAEALCSLLFPFRLTQLYIPWLPAEIIHMLRAPVGYFVGTHADHLGLPGCDLDEVSFALVDLDRGLLVPPIERIGDDGETERPIPDLPEDIRRAAASEFRSHVRGTPARGASYDLDLSHPPVRCDVQYIRAAGVRMLCALLDGFTLDDFRDSLGGVGGVGVEMDMSGNAGAGAGAAVVEALLLRRPASHRAFLAELFLSQTWTLLAEEFLRQAPVTPEREARLRVFDNYLQLWQEEMMLASIVDVTHMQTPKAGERARLPPLSKILFPVNEGSISNLPANPRAGLFPPEAAAKGSVGITSGRDIIVRLTGTGVDVQSPFPIGFQGETQAGGNANGLGEADASIAGGKKHAGLSKAREGDDTALRGQMSDLCLTPLDTCAADSAFSNLENSVTISADMPTPRCTSSASTRSLQSSSSSSCNNAFSVLGSPRSPSSRSTKKSMDVSSTFDLLYVTPRGEFTPRSIDMNLTNSVGGTGGSAPTVDGLTAAQALQFATTRASGSAARGTSGRRAHSRDVSSRGAVTPRAKTALFFGVAPKEVVAGDTTTSHEAEADALFGGSPVRTRHGDAWSMRSGSELNHASPSSAAPMERARAPSTATLQSAVKMRARRRAEDDAQAAGWPMAEGTPQVLERRSRPLFVDTAANNSADWSMVWDEVNMAYYYYNNATGETKWQCPECIPRPFAWSERWDETSRSYYYTKGEEESTWVRPKIFNPAGSSPSIE